MYSAKKVQFSVKLYEFVIMFHCKSHTNICLNTINFMCNIVQCCMVASFFLSSQLVGRL